MTERLAGIGQEHDTRIAAVRALMLERRLDVALVSAPENIFYLTGLGHWGYFAPHMLIVPLQGEVVLVTRAMEREIGRAHVCTPVTNAPLVCRLLLSNKQADDMSARDSEGFV